jgi:hypothetical protein
VVAVVLRSVVLLYSNGTMQSVVQIGGLHLFLFFPFVFAVVAAADVIFVVITAWMMNSLFSYQFSFFS